MIHAFNKLGEYFVLDVESGSLMEVSKSAYLGIKLKTNQASQQEIDEYNQLPLDERNEINSEIDELISEGILDSKDVRVKPLSVTPVIKAMCLNISHDCNLRCKYCFANEGKYKSGFTSMMSKETARKAIDWLIACSGPRRNLEVDFFGGEPMMNYKVVQDCVEYARSKEKEHNKFFRFTITTNATLIKPDQFKWLDDNMFNVVLSIDGRKSVHDMARPNANGDSTYDASIKNALVFKELRSGKKDYYVRGTYTALNLDFSEDVKALNDLGFDQISLEPVALPETHFMAIKEEHLPIIQQEYDKLAKLYLDAQNSNHPFNFFHFNIDLDGGPCAAKRLTGCGAGFEYVAVSCNGDIYPCHQFDGDQNFKMGNVNTGITDPKVGEQFAKTNVLTKEKCRNCWAKYYCSGGCNANHFFTNGSFNVPSEMVCKLMQMRIESALAVKAILKAKE